MNQNLTIILKAVSKKFGTRTLFSDITCQIHSGACLVITGGNGTGKTTLVKMIGRLIRPTSGVIEMEDGDTRLKDSEQFLPYIGLVSPEVILYDQLTAKENIELLTQTRDIHRTDGEIADCLESMGLSGQSTQRVRTFSTGMKQRLKFALLAAADPPVWLIDEGLSNLDGSGRALVLSLIESAIAERRVVVLATNEQAEVAYASQTIDLSQYHGGCQKRDSV